MKNNDNINVDFEVTNNKYKEYETTYRLNSSRIGGPQLNSPSRNDYGDKKATSYFTSPHVLSLVPAGGAGNIGSYRNTNSSNLVTGGGAPKHDRRAPLSV